MKTVIVSTFLGLAISLVTAVSAVPAPSIESDVTVNLSVPLNAHTWFAYNVTLPPNITSSHTVSALGYDPSNDWQMWATVEVWTGGSRRQPVNVGNVIGHELHQLIARMLDGACPFKTIQYRGYCDNWNWQNFGTKYLKTPPAGIDTAAVFFRVNGGQYATEEIRVTLLNIVGRVLFAYTTQPLGTNCYEIPGQGKFCNIPQFVRINLPNTSPANPDWENYLHVEFYGGCGVGCQFSKHGNLKPCGTRAAVDEQLDIYRGVLEGQFVEWRGHFKRDTRVIIDGYKVCTDEP